MRNIDGIRGLKDLFVSAVNGGTTAVEEIHSAIARRPFEALELDPVTRVPAARFGCFTTESRAVSIGASAA